MKLYSLLTKSFCLLSLASLFLIGCQDPTIEEIIVEEQNSTPHTYVDQPANARNSIETPVHGQYIVHFNTENPSEGFKELSGFQPIKVEKSQRKRKVPTTNTKSKYESETFTTNLEPVAKKLLKAEGINPKGLKEVFQHAAAGFLVEMTEAEAKKLENNPNVDFLEQDALIAMNFEPLIRTPFIPSDTDEASRQKPYGVDMMGGSVDFTKDSRWANTFVWIIDTGIDTDHPDLNVRVDYSVDFSKDNNIEDVLGHGTHVAGIIAAKEDGVGVSGIAAGAQVVSVKIINDKGQGLKSDFLRAIEYVITYSLPGDVINISLGGSNSNSYKSAIRKAVASLQLSGLYVTIAAGNEGIDVKNITPANIDGFRIYTVGAIDWDKQYTDYSNYGTSVDFAAPGHGILSTYIGGKYAFMSGTSMAAPHIAGVMVLEGMSFQYTGMVNSKGGIVPTIRHRN